MKPLLAHVYEPHRVNFPCFVQPKLNGVRALYQNGRFQSRNEHPFPELLLRHLAAPLLKVFGPETILDGELYVHGWRLQQILGAVTPVRKEEKEDTQSVEYHVFDVVDFTKSFEERCRTGQNGIATIWANTFSRQIKNVLTRKVFNEKEANYSYSEFVSSDYEGMMYRLGDCPYTLPKQPRTEGHGWMPGNTRFLSNQDNRCWHLLKRKNWQDAEFEIIGVVEGEGKYENKLGAIICEQQVIGFGTKQFTVGSGFSDLDRDKYWNHPELVVHHFAKVRFLCLSEDGIPLNPTILAIL